MAELGDFLTYSGSGEDAAVTVEMLDYDYINTCTDPKKLRGIVMVLKSGKEGVYPELLRAAEDKLLSVLPSKERNRILKLRQQATPDEISEAEHDVDRWVQDISSLDRKLKTAAVVGREVDRPPVRGKEGVTKIPISTGSIKEKPTKVSNNNASDSKSKPKRLSGYDFRAWEKFDVDAAIADIDESDNKAENSNSQRNGHCMDEEISQKRQALFAREMHKWLEKMNAGNLSETQRTIIAGREKEKGNECFRCGEHEMAFEHYSCSIALDPMSPVYFTNRALVAIKLNRYETADDDCTRALQIDSGLVKAWWLRASAKLHRGRCADAISDYTEALKLDPENTGIKDMLKKAVEKFEEIEGRPYSASRPAENEGGCLFDTTDIISVQTWGELNIPVSYEVLDVSPLRSVANGHQTESYTRIAIDDEEETEESCSKEATASEIMTRIKIDEDIDEEEESKVALNDFTRIRIMSDSEDDEEPQDEVDREALEELKSQGNTRMKDNDLIGAISSYTRCIELARASKLEQQEKNTVLIAALNNRSFAYLTAKNYTDAILDATSVLALDSLNLKALYRRALAYEAVGSWSMASLDVQQLLSMDKDNALGQELYKRVNIEAERRTRDACVDELESQHIKDRVKNLLAEGKYDEAITLLAQKVSSGQASDDLSMLQLLMSAYKGIRDDDKVVSCATRILALEPSNFSALLLRGNANINKKRYSDARNDALSAIRIDPTNNEAMSLLDAAQELEDSESGEEPDHQPLSLDIAGESNRLKDAGNEALGKDNFDKAVALYSEAIRVDCSNMAALNNRSLAYLKMNRFADSEKDATLVLENDKALGNTPNVKALYRRGMARKNIGGRDSLKSALEDFSLLLSIEPGNKVAKTEKAKVEQLISDFSSGSAGKASSPGPASAAAAGPIGMVERSTTLKKKDTVTPSPIVHPAITTSSVASTTVIKTPEKSGCEKRNVSSSSGGRKKKEPDVPDEPPRTLYELERIWRGLKSRPDLFARYIKTFSVTTFKNVFKEAMTPDLLSSILSTIRTEIAPTAAEEAKRLLEAMTNICKFDMTISLLPEEDLATLKSIFSSLQVHLGNDSIGDLSCVYGLNR